MGFLVLPEKLIESNYYKYILSSNDKITLHTLFRKVLVNDGKYYDNGMLVINSKIGTLSLESGIKYSTIKDSLNKLDSLGIAVKLEKISKNYRYFIGFRTMRDNRLYLIDHLIAKTDVWLDRSISAQKDEFKKIYQIPVIKDLSLYKLDKKYKDFIVKISKNPTQFINSRLENGKTLFQEFFERSDAYVKPLLFRRELLNS